jgi:hypothetical protein
MYLVPWEIAIAHPRKALDLLYPILPSAIK